MSIKFFSSRKFLLFVSIIGLFLVLGFGAYFYFSNANDRVKGTLQVFPDPAKAYDMPAFSNTNDLLNEAGVVLSPDQLLFVNGELESPHARLPQYATVEVLTIHTITISVDGVTQTLQTFEPTVSRVLAEVGLHLAAADRISTSLDSFVSSSMAIQIQTAKPVIILLDGQSFNFESAERTPAAILSEFGFTPIGNDSVTNEIVADGSQVIRVETARETVHFEILYNSFATIQKYSADLATGETVIEQAGSPGVTLTTFRDSVQNNTNRGITIGPSIVSEPVDQIVLTSSQTGVFSLETDAGDLQYWKVLEMYTTSYSPCNSGTDKCLTGTSSGLPAGYGVVAVIPSVFNALNGTQVYIPGYGIGIIGDVGGGFPDGRPWIDLGFDDSNYTGWYGYHTVYFLGSPPAYDPFQ